MELTDDQVNLLMDAALHTHDKERYDAVCKLRRELGLNALPVKEGVSSAS